MKLLKTFLLTLTFVGFYSEAAQPFLGLKEEQAVCFGREYSAEHMEKHPDQTVEKMRLKFVKKDGFIYLDIEASLLGTKNQYINYRAPMGCYEAENGSFQCGIDCDGGSVGLQVKDNGDRVVLKNNGFVLDGGCGEEERNLVWLNNIPKGDDVFYTYKLRSEFCQN